MSSGDDDGKMALEPVVLKMTAVKSVPGMRGVLLHH